VAIASDKVILAGVQIDNLNESTLIKRILNDHVAGHGGWMVNPNVDVLRQIHANRELQSLIEQADLLIADGMPLIWASHIRNTPLCERVAGGQLIWTLSAAAADSEIPIFLLGGNVGVAERARMALCARYPHLRVAGTHCPPLGFENDSDRIEEIILKIERTSPGVVFCGLGFPKQERLMAALAQRFPEIWFVGSGASLTMAAGDVRRAPRWMQQAGLEWFYRLLQEPRRLFSRYIFHDVPFALRLIVWSARDRQSGISKTSSSRNKFDSAADASVSRLREVDNA